MTIKLSNPDSYEIMSFTLNGKKYSNYMFEEGSDMENLILKVNVGSQAGIKEYTIDAIKYIDGTTIKDVIMDGDKTVKAGIRTTNMVTTVVTNQKVTLTSLSFDLSISDGYSLIEQAKVILFDGNSVVGEKDVIAGNNKVEFTGLTPNTLYQYAVAATYDDLSGKGSANYVLYKDAFYTDTIVLFAEPTITQTSIDWDYVWDATMDNKMIVSQELYLDNEKVEDIDISTKILNDLLSNRAYTIKTTYKNINNENEVINLYFVTQAKAIPTLQIVDVTSDKTSISFDIDITDTDNVGELTKLELLHGTDEPVQLALDQRTITDLLSNNMYTIRATYTYDLNDGEGRRTLTIDATYMTLSREVTVTGITILNATNPKVGEEVHVRISLENPDSVEITNFYINGMKTEVLSGNRITNVIVKFVPVTEGGEYNVKLSAINYTANGIAVKQDISTEYIASIVVLGNIEVVDVKVASNNYNYVSSTEKTIKVILNNPTRYDVYYVNLPLTNMQGTEYKIETVMSEDKDYFMFELPTIIQSLTIKSIEFGVSGYEGTLELQKELQFRVVISSEIVKVSNPQQLADMKEDRIYSLENDIDLNLVKWNPYRFSGILLGNGCSILNLSIVVENKVDDVQYYGLFTELGHGSVHNLNLLDVYISVKTYGGVFVGGLAGYVGSGSLIKNVHLSGQIYVDTEVINGNVYVGGVVGDGMYFDVYNTINDVDLDVVLDCNKSSFANIGGVIGSIFYGHIYNSYSIGNITVSNDADTIYVGGFVGNTGGVGGLIVKNSYATGDVIVDGLNHRNVLGKFAGNTIYCDMENIYTFIHQKELFTIKYDFEIDSTLDEIWQFVYNNWDDETWNLYLDKHPTLK